MQEYERKQLLERIGREGATIGARIPDRIEVQGEEFDLKSFVFEVKKLNQVPAEDRERVDEAKKLLRRERIERKEQIEEGDISFEEGEELANAIIGIDRALNALESLGTTNLEAEEEAQERADQKRWYTFLKKALGHKNDDGRSRHR